ncbi:MAG: hypothetical protein ACI86H_002762 [bacterium]|jgi:hypothetical protein
MLFIYLFILFFKFKIEAHHKMVKKEGDVSLVEYYNR